MNPTSISISNHKGGVGKTTTAMNLAAFMSRSGMNVLLVDCDAQGNLTTLNGLPTKMEGRTEGRTIFDALAENKNLPIIHVGDHLDIVPSDIRLSNIEAQMVGVKGRVLRLASLLKPFRDRYDVIILDCPPFLGVGNNSALVASDYVIVPMEASLLSVKGLQVIDDTINAAHSANPNLRLGGIAITRYRNTRDQRSVMNEIRERYPGQLFDTVIRETTSISAAQLARKDIFTYDAHCIGAVDYGKLAMEIITKLI